MTADRDLLTDALVADGWDGEDALDLAVTLLPVVDRIANQRAAAELRAAADGLAAPPTIAEHAVLRRSWANRLRNRATDLDPNTEGS